MNKIHAISILLSVATTAQTLVSAAAKDAVEKQSALKKNTYTIRKYTKADVPDLVTIITQVRAEFGFGAQHPKAHLIEAELKQAFDIYDGNHNNYFVAELESKIVGGGGYAVLSSEHKDIAEIKGMYLLPETRGSGVGSILLQRILEETRVHGFKKCYLETMDFMHGANKLYTKFGFKTIDKPLIATHTWTNRYYIKDL